MNTKKTNRIRLIVFICLGIILILVSALTDSYNKTFSDILLKLGVVALSIVFLDQIWRLVGGDPIKEELKELSAEVVNLKEVVKVLEETQKVGLIGVRKNMGTFGNHQNWLDLIRKAKSEVDLMGRTLYGWTQSNETAEVIKNKITNEKIKVRWLIMDVENHYIEGLIKTEKSSASLLKEKIRATTKLVEQIKKSLPKNLQENIEIQFFKDIPLYFSTIRIDEEIYINQYFQSLSSSDCPIYIVNDLSKYWSSIFKKEFDLIWENSIKEEKKPMPNKA